MTVEELIELLRLLPPKTLVVRRVDQTGDEITYTKAPVKAFNGTLDAEGVWWLDDDAEGVRVPRQGERRAVLLD